MSKKKKMIICFVLGMVGCLCFGGFFGANVLVNYGVLYAVALLIPNGAVKLAFTNGLIILFAALIICTAKNIGGVADENDFMLIP